MDAIKELVKIVNRKRLSTIDVFDKTFINAESQNLYYKLYEAIEEGKITDDVSAAQYLYNSDEKDAKYRKLKSRFRAKLLKSILLFDIPDVSNSESVRAYYECLTHNQTIEIIIKLTGTTKLVAELVKDNYAKALKYNFYDILKNYSYYLITYYSLKGDKKSMLEEEYRYVKFVDLATREQYAKYLYMKVAVEFSRPKPITTELMAEVKDNLNRFYDFKKDVDNPEIDFYYHYMDFLYLTYTNQLEQLLKICKAANKLMDDNPAVVTNTRRFAVLFYELSSYLHMRRYQDGVAVLSKFDALTLPETNINWYLLKEKEFLLYFQMKDIPKAYEVFESVMTNKTFKRQSVQITEKWKIFQAYLVFVDNYINNGDYKFSLPKFLNEVPHNSKDKSGLNFAIRMIELLFNVARKDYNLIFSKMDALRIYRTRYLNDNTYKRNHLLLSILLRAEKTGFNSKEMLNADWPEIDALRKFRGNIVADWEIVPFEEIWDMFAALTYRE